jgi:dTDP-4-dehydrorhamnose 3,5-epimerase
MTSLFLIKKNKEKKILNPKGNLFHIIKTKSNGYKGFGEAYFSWVESKKIKGWKKHYKMTLNLLVPVGKVQFVFFSENNKTFRSFIIGENNYYRLTVPPKIWFAFKGISKTKSLVLNFANISHKSDTIKKMSLNKIKFNWE